MAQPQTYGATPDSGTSETVDLTKEEGRQVAEDAKQQAGAVAGTAKEQAGTVANEAMHHVQDLATDAKHQLHQQARQQTDAFGNVIGTLGGRVKALANGDVDEAGPVGDYAQRLAGQVDQFANRVDELGFDGMIDEVQRYARRKPGAFLLGAAVAGFAVSRLARGAQAAQSHDQSGSAGMSNTMPSTGTTAPTGMGGSPTGTTAGAGLTPGSGPTTPGMGAGLGTGADVGTPPVPPMPRTGSPATGLTTSPSTDDDLFTSGRDER
ncbi:hypothetical protein [Egicoccus sp. AB-alg6-2]|uniref:hypothetical protein n=1 Tax=Egicoccus sp. AB-alg6-2 TaxID=3242692 RepID=UPI00359E8424